MSVVLKSGEWTNDIRLDRCRHVDLRNLNYLANEDWLGTDEYNDPRSYTWRLDVRLDQGQEGACVGFGWGAELAARPGVVTGITDLYCKQKIYWPAQERDPWAGGAYPGASPWYEGTTVQAGAQVLLSAGLIDQYRWALELMDMIVTIGYRGPVVIGVDWYQGMMSPDASGYIHPTGKIVGGHCVVVYGVKVVRNADGSVDHLRSYFKVQNSWGADWGQDGRCLITFAETLVLWPGGDFCVPVGRHKAVAA